MKPKLSEDEVSQTIDLKKVLGEVSEVESVSEAFAQALIDKIVARTTLGRDVSGKIFPKYSKSYSESLAFKVFGKSRGDVNMTLTGDMLASIEPEIEQGKLKIQVTGSDNILKAFAHMTGYRGHPFLAGKPKREFFGISEKELAEVKKNFLPDLSQESKKNDEIIINKLRKLVDE